MFSFTEFRKSEIRSKWLKREYFRAAILIFHGLPQFFYGEVDYIKEVRKNGSADKNLKLILYRTLFHMIGGSLIIPIFLWSYPVGLGSWMTLSTLMTIQEFYQAHKAGFHAKNVSDAISWALPGALYMLLFS